MKRAINFYLVLFSGIYLLVWGGLFVLGVFAFLIRPFIISSSNLCIFASYAVCAVICSVTGIGIIDRKNWARICLNIISVSLIIFGLGSLLHMFLADHLGNYFDYMVYDFIFWPVNFFFGPFALILGLFLIVLKFSLIFFYVAMPALFLAALNTREAKELFTGSSMIPSPAPAKIKKLIWIFVVGSILLLLPSFLYLLATMAIHNDSGIKLKDRQVQIPVRN